MPLGKISYIKKEILDTELLIEQKLLHLESERNKLLKGGYKDDSREIIFINMTIEKLEKKKQKIYEDIRLDTPIDSLRITYPYYFEKFNKRFNIFFDNWLKTSENKSDVESIRRNLFSYCAKLVYERVVNDSELGSLIQRFEDNPIPIDDDDVYGEGMLEYISEKPIEDVFEVPGLILASLGNERKNWIKKIDAFEDELKMRNRVEEIRNEKIKKLMSDKRKLTDDAKKPSKNELIRLIDENRKKNGKINYSKTAKELGRTHHTIRSWCEEIGIK